MKCTVRHYTVAWQTFRGCPSCDVPPHSRPLMQDGSLEGWEYNNIVK